jgi:hypothetical protein
VTIEGLPTAVDSGGGQGNFSHIEVVAKASAYHAYFNTKDTAGNFVVASTQGRPADAYSSTGSAAATTDVALGAQFLRCCRKPRRVDDVRVAGKGAIPGAALSTLHRNDRSGRQRTSRTSCW